MNFRSETRSETALALFLAVAGAALRVWPHPWNVAPVAAVALFAGMTLSRRLALAVPLGAMVLSDLALGMHGLWPITWGSFVLIALAGSALSSRPGWLPVAFGAFGGSVFFFVASNLGVFLFERMYPLTWAGFVECFTLALPFFRNTLLGDLAYAAAVFGVFALAKTRAKALAPGDRAA